MVGAEALRYAEEAAHVEQQPDQEEGALRSHQMHHWVARVGEVLRTVLVTVLAVMKRQAGQNEVEERRCDAAVAAAFRAVGAVVLSHAAVVAAASCAVEEAVLSHAAVAAAAFRAVGAVVLSHAAVVAAASCAVEEAVQLHVAVAEVDRLHAAAIAGAAFRTEEAVVQHLAEAVRPYRP